VAGAFMLAYTTIIEYHIAVTSALQGSKLQKLATRIKPRINCVATPKSGVTTSVAKNIEEVVMAMLRI
jgi:hypothetical protein